MHYEHVYCSGFVTLRIEEAVLVSPRHAAALQSIARFDQTSSSSRITSYLNVFSLHPTSSRYKSSILLVHSLTMSLILDDPRDTCSSHGDDASGDTEPPVEQDAHAGVKLSNTLFRICIYIVRCLPPHSHSDESHQQQQQYQQQELIRMGPGRTGVKGVIRDSHEAAALKASRRAREMEEVRRRMERAHLGGKTFLEDEALKATAKTQTQIWTPTDQKNAPISSVCPDQAALGICAKSAVRGSWVLLRGRIGGLGGCAFV
jgi:hypothetical protein